VKPCHSPRPQVRPPDRHFRGWAHCLKTRKSCRSSRFWDCTLPDIAPMGFDDVRDERQKIIEQWSF